MERTEKELEVAQLEMKKA